MCFALSFRACIQYPQTFIPSLQILVEDLFGVPAEEREAGVSVARIPESKNPQSYNSYGLVAQFLSPGLLPQLLAPIKEVV